MDGQQCKARRSQRTERSHWDRGEAAACRHRARLLRESHSERSAACRAGVPRSTLRNWWQRQQEIDLPAEGEFFESPQGVEWLRRIQVALRLVFCEAGPCGTRSICKFLKLTGLDRFIAASYGSQYGYGVQLQEALGQFSREQTAVLSAGMRPREITVCEDETFHPQTCLVAIEPLSNFILLEQYADHLDAEVWTQSLENATCDLPVTIVQATSDEGRSLAKHCRVGLEAHHSPDVFHVQQKVSRAFSGKLNGAVKRARTEVRREKRETSRLQAEAEAHSPSHSEFFRRQLQLAQADEDAARKRLEAEEEKRQQVRDEVRGISHDYHPFDLQTGQPRQADQVKRDLNQRFDNLEAFARQFDLSQTGREAIAKARKNIRQMAATIAFFWQLFFIKIKPLNLPANLLWDMLAASYLELASQRASQADERRRLKTLSQSLWARVRDGPLRELEDSQSEHLLSVVRDCAGMFQRSSSCVEGRNGWLALHHHGLHRLSHRKMTALNALHNFFIQRPDGTTAAERFFGAPPPDLFQWLLGRLPWPPRPRRRPT